MKTKMNTKSEILSQPELLLITPVGVKLSTITFLLALIAFCLYSMLFYAAIQAIPQNSLNEAQYHTLLAIVIIVGAGIAILTVYALVTKKKQPLVFTTIGIGGIDKYAIKYSELARQGGHGLIMPTWNNGELVGKNACPPYKLVSSSSASYKLSPQ